MKVWETNLKNIKDLILTKLNLKLDQTTLNLIFDKIKAFKRPNQQRIKKIQLSIFTI